MSLLILVTPPIQLPVPQVSNPPVPQVSNPIVQVKGLTAKGLIVQVKGLTAKELLDLDMRTIDNQFVSKKACKATFEQIKKDLKAGLVMSCDTLEKLGTKCVTYIDKVLVTEHMVDANTEALCTEIKVTISDMIRKIKLVLKKRSGSPIISS